MRLSDFFNDNEVVVDAEVKITNYASSTFDKTAALALSERYLMQAIENPFVSAIITTSKLLGKKKVGKGLVITDDAKKRFYSLHNYLVENPIVNLISKHYVSNKAKISKTAIIKKNVIIEDDVIVEDYSIIESNSIIKKGAYIGQHVVIGAKGMYNNNQEGEAIPVYDAGGVVVEEKAQILAHAVIQKSIYYGVTRVGRNSTISVLSNVSHGCDIGENTMIAGNVALAGYVVVGDNVWIGPSVTVAHGLSIGNKAEVLLGSVVISNIESSKKVSGNFAMKHSKNLMRFAKETR